MQIGNLEINRPLCLAPMEDVSDRPFRLLCREHGADLLYTEFASCEALIRDVKRTMRKIEVLPEERPIAIQVYGSNLDSMTRAAALAESMQPDFIDLNAGCWVKKIANRGDGAGLLRDLDRFKAVVQAVQRGTSLPVTVKTRLGWDDDSIVILDVAPMLEDLGVAALTVHCRTRCQGYTGEADWSWLPQIKAASGIPLIANGDIKTPEDAKTCFDLGADGVMIGRGAITNPWIFEHTKRYLATGERPPDPNREARVAICTRPLTAQAEYRGERRGVITFRKHYASYLKGVHNIAHLRRDLMQYEEVAPVIERLHRFLQDYRSEDPSDETSVN